MDIHGISTVQGLRDACDKLISEGHGDKLAMIFNDMEAEKYYKNYGMRDNPRPLTTIEVAKVTSYVNHMGETIEAVEFIR
jgi:hypothetical protein